MRTYQYNLGRRRVSESAGVLRVSIPKLVVEKSGLEKGDEVEMIYDELHNTLTLYFPRKKGVKRR